MLGELWEGAREKREPKLWSSSGGRALAGQREAQQWVLYYLWDNWSNQGSELPQEPVAICSDTFQGDLWTTSVLRAMSQPLPHLLGHSQLLGDSNKALSEKSGRKRINTSTDSLPELSFMFLYQYCLCFTFFSP